MVTERKVFETDDGKQFNSQDEALEHEATTSLAQFLNDNCGQEYFDFDADYMAKALRSHFVMTPVVIEEVKKPHVPDEDDIPF